MRKMSESAKEKIRKYRIGKKMSEETKLKISLKNKGRIFTEEQKRKSGCPKGTKRSKATRDKMGKAKIGVKMSEEIKKKISLSSKGRKAWNKGIKQTLDSIRKNSEAHLGIKNSAWKGGISFERYPVDWTRTLRIAIRERDKYTCKICGEKQGDVTHHVHHIDYDKKNCNLDNLITLCGICHGRTNYNREYWIGYFNK